MNNEKLLNAIGKIDDKLIYDALNDTKKSKKNLRIILSTAACFCIVFITAVSLFKSNKKSNKDLGESNITVTDAGVHIPKMQINISDNASADMIAFFIYQNRCYTNYLNYSGIEINPDIIGDYLGTATGSINEWSTKDEYIEFSGSVAGDFYSVKGYNPDFMLCMKENDKISLYINNNGITLKNGSDIFEEKLHLSDNYKTVQYQTREDWYYSRGNIKTLDIENFKNAEILSEFIAALYEAPFMRIDDIPLERNVYNDPFEKNNTSVYDDKEIYHIYFQMDKGIVVHLRLFEGGYVQFNGINGVCVHMSEEYFNNFIDTLKN